MNIIMTLLIVCFLIFIANVIFSEKLNVDILIGSIIAGLFIAVSLLAFAKSANYRSPQIIDVPNENIVIMKKEPKDNFFTNFYDLKDKYSIEKVTK